MSFKHYVFILLTVIAVGVIVALSETFGAGKKRPVEGSVYDFKMKGIDGHEIDFATYRGKYLLIVNTASKCGFTPQYDDLEKLHRERGDKVTVLGFPSNNFLFQEPGSNAAIADFCKLNYGVTFQLFEKISVRGRHKAPLYEWLNAKTGELPTWNFCKYLIGPTGEVIGFFPTKVKPMDPEIMDKIK